METYTITQFGGLNEVDPPDDIGIENAQALSNVDYDNSLGALRQRWGTVALSSALTTAPYSLYAGHPSRFLTTHETGVGTITIVVLNTSGSSTATQAISAGYEAHYATLGTPSTTTTYIATGGTLYKYTTAGGFATEAGAPDAYFVAVQPNDNRLVGAATPSGANGPGGATSSLHHVWFSDPGDATTWGANNYVQLTPGDGDFIRGVVTWQDKVFVFKRSRIFVFYGNSTDADGNPVFNYRTIELARDQKVWGGGAVSPGNGLMGPIACASADGVYYCGENGVFLTTGDQPARVSGPISWTSSAGSEAASSATPEYIAQPAVVGEKLYVSSYHETSTGANGVYVFDLRAREWLYHSTFATLTAVAPSGDTGVGVFANAADKKIHTFNSSANTTDNGTAISSYWTSGLSNLGYESEKQLKYIDVWGTGTVSLSVQSDFGSAANATTLTLGTSPAIAKARYTTSAKGDLLGIKLASVSGAAWKVHRITLYFEANKVGTSLR